MRTLIGSPKVRPVIRGGPLAAREPAGRTAALTARCPVSWNGAHACRLQQGHSGKHVSGSGWNYT
jgi:hypothetical protein